MSEEEARIESKFLYPPKTAWSNEEDALLTKVVQERGAKRWNSIAESIPGRTGKQCRERWMSHIAPNVRSGEWTEDEIELLVRLQSEFGNKWSKISQYFVDRPPNVIKNKFNCLLRRIKSPKNIKNSMIINNVEYFITSPEIDCQNLQNDNIYKRNMIISEAVHFDYIDDELLFENDAKEQWQEEF